jgi:hypothetical protein
MAHFNEFGVEQNIVVEFMDAQLKGREPPFNFFSRHGEILMNSRKDLRTDLYGKWSAAALLLILAGCGGSAESREGEGIALESEISEPVEVVTELEDPVTTAPLVSPAPSQSSGATTPARPAPATPPPAATPPPSPPPSRVVSVPAGTTIPAVMEVTLSTRTHNVGDIFHAQISEEILAADGMVLVPQGARLEGRVVQASQSSSSQEEALLLLTFENLLIQGERYPIDAVVTEVAMESSAQASGTRTAATVATGAAAGAVVGRILGGGTRSTVAGAVVGAVAGTGVALTTRDGHASINQGARVVVRLDSPTVLSGR